jgi:hypothetical protein
MTLDWHRIHFYVDSNVPKGNRVFGIGHPFSPVKYFFFNPAYADSIPTLVHEFTEISIGNAIREIDCDMKWIGFHHIVALFCDKKRKDEQECLMSRKINAQPLIVR